MWTLPGTGPPQKTAGPGRAGRTIARPGGTTQSTVDRRFNFYLPHRTKGAKGGEKLVTELLLPSVVSQIPGKGEEEEDLRPVKTWILDPCHGGRTGRRAFTDVNDISRIAGNHRGSILVAGELLLDS